MAKIEIEIIVAFTTECGTELEIEVTPTTEQDIIDAIIEEAESQDLELDESNITIDEDNVTHWGELEDYEDYLDLETVYAINDANIDDYLELDIVLAYADNVGINYISDVGEAYQGQYNSDEDFAEDMAEQIGAVDKNAAWPNNCIDWEQAAQELMYDYFESNGYYFRSL